MRKRIKPTPRSFLAGGQREASPPAQFSTNAARNTLPPRPSFTGAPAPRQFAQQQFPQQQFAQQHFFQHQFAQEQFARQQFAHNQRWEQQLAPHQHAPGPRQFSTSARSERGEAYRQNASRAAPDARPYWLPPAHDARPAAGGVGKAPKPKKNKAVGLVGVASRPAQLPSRGYGRDPPAPPLEVPVPSAAYVARADEASVRLAAPARLLVILDLNGTLLCRKKGKNAQGSAAPVKRPGLVDFLDYLFDNFSVMIWTSARPENARRMVDAVFTRDQDRRLLAVWGRDTLDLSEKQYNAKVQIYKKLGRVFTGRHAVNTPAGATTFFDQSNTVLFDDSFEKACGEPWNLVQVPEFEATYEQNRNDRALEQCMEYLEALKWESNVSSYIRQHPFKYVKQGGI